MHNNIMAAGLKDRPPMLATRRYAQWRSRFLCYIDTKPNGDALRKCILKGPYKPTTVVILAVAATHNSPAVPQHTTVKTILNMFEENKAHFRSEKEATFLLLTGIGDEIYSTVDACKTAHDMWVAIERLQQGESLNIQDYQKEVNKLRADRIAKSANPLTLVVAAQPYLDNYYQALKPQQSYAPAPKQSFSTRSNASTRHKGKEIAKPITPPSESRSDKDSDLEQSQKPKQVKDYTYHKEKMLLCKQAEKDSDTTVEPLTEVRYNDDYNVFANDKQHSEKSEHIINTCVVETVDSNIIPDSPNMCDNDDQTDQNTKECDDEHDVLANLITNLTLDTKENKKILKQLKKANASLTYESEKCQINLEETTRALGETTSSWDSCLIAIQNKQTELDGSSKQVTQQIFPQTRKQATRNTNVIKPGIYRISTSTTQTKAPQLSHTSRNTNPHVSTSTEVNHSTSVSIPHRKRNQVKDKVVLKNSQVKFKKIKVEDHHRISSISNKTKSVTACNDSLNSKTLNVNDVCATCRKCVFNSNRDACVSKYLNDVNARTKKPSVVPISARKPKNKANTSVATTHKKTIALDTTIQKSKSYFRELYENKNKTWKWWIEKQSTVCFGNDQFALILGYRDLIQGNVTIKRVYYVEGLNHNLLSVGQFCDADLEVAFRKSTCYVRDLQGNNLLTGPISQRQEMYVDNDTSDLVPPEQKASDYDNSGPVPQLQNVVPPADSSQQVLEFLFSRLFEEYFFAGNSSNGKQTIIDPSNMHTFYQLHQSKHGWKKDHPLEQVRGNPSKPVQKRRQLETDPEMCMFALTELVDKPFGKTVVKIKWLGKNKKDEDQSVIRNKARLVDKGYAQEKGIDFEESFAPAARL
uniref:Retrovirus-related Pol polyprotein from transposon TNT 1-94 n=1 Tax=Tanacetum cinerariifolium TaxID=118510 RepID=A0A6L2K8G7_TANCI|nr:retrovirus-related Pol polyprotein from transposon TNT 1-94 [Tanacetum cinerariifolium]